MAHSRWEKALLPIKEAFTKAQQDLIYRLLGSSPPVDATPARHLRKRSQVPDLFNSATPGEAWEGQSLRSEERVGKGLFPISLMDLKQQLYGRRLVLKKYNTNKEFHPIPTLISVALQDDYFTRNSPNCFTAANWYSFFLESIEDAYEEVSREAQFLIQDYLAHLIVNAGLAYELRQDLTNETLSNRGALVDWLRYHGQKIIKQLNEHGVDSQLRSEFRDGTLDDDDSTIHIVWSKEH